MIGDPKYTDRKYTIELDDGAMVPFVPGKGGRDAVAKVEERTGKTAVRYSVPGIPNTWIRVPR